MINTLLKYNSYLELYCYKETYQSLISTRVHASPVEIWPLDLQCFTSVCE